MMSKMRVAFSASLLLCAMTATTVHAVEGDRVRQFVQPSECGSGATTTLFPLTQRTQDFGIGRTNLAILAKVEANSGSRAGYVSYIYISPSRSAIADVLSGVVIYFKTNDNSSQKASLRDMSAHVEYRYYTRESSSLDIQSVSRNVRFSDLDPPIAGVDGWKSVKIDVGATHPDGGAFTIRLFLNGRSNRDEMVKFGKIEFYPKVEGSDTDIDGSVAAKPKACI